MRDTNLAQRSSQDDRKWKTLVLIEWTVVYLLYMHEPCGWALQSLVVVFVRVIYYLLGSHMRLRSCIIFSTHLPSTGNALQVKVLWNHSPICFIHCSFWYKLTSCHSNTLRGWSILGIEEARLKTSTSNDLIIIHLTFGCVARFIASIMPTYKMLKYLDTFLYSTKLNFNFDNFTIDCSFSRSRT